MSQINLGLAGAGVIGQRHLKAMESHPGISAIGIADPSSAAQEVAEKIGIPCYDDTDVLLSKQKLDGLIIATPTEYHLAPTLGALRAGVPVLVEKPIMPTVEEAEQVIRASEESGCAVLVGHHRRYYELVNKTRELVQGGAIGSLVCVSGQWNARKPDDYYMADWRKRWKAGPILTNLIHDMDLLRYICGDIDSIIAETSNVVQGYDKEDAAVLAMRFSNGALGSFILSDQTPSPWTWEFGTGESHWAPASGQNAFRFMGTEGALEFPNLVHWQHQGTSRDWHHAMQSESLSFSLEDAFVEQIRHFAAVIGGAEKAKVDARDATATLRATLGVYKSASCGARVLLG